MYIKVVQSLPGILDYIKITLNNLVKFIIQVKAEGNKVILAADVNELAVDGQLSIALK